MKQEIKLVAIALVALILFVSGFGLGATKGITINVNGGGSVAANSDSGETTTQTATTTTQTATTTTQPQTTNPPSGGTDATTTTTQPSGGSSSTSVPSTPAEVAAAYNKAINAYKAFTGNVTCKKTETINIQVKDLPAAAAAIVNKAVESFTGTKEETFVFTNGVDPDGRKPADKMIPGGRDAAVDPAGLASATATANADGGYTMDMKFVEEKSVFDDTKNTSEPTYHMGAMDPLNLGDIELPSPISITGADLTYPGATVKCTVDGQGRLTKLDVKLPLTGSGSGKAIVSLTIGMEGSMDSVYEISYQ